MSTNLRPVRALAVAAALPLLLAACTSSGPGDQPGRVATAEDAVTHEQNDRVPEGASWTQHYFPSPTPGADGAGAELHADVLLPEDLPEGEQVPVILSVGAYFGHAGELSDEGLAHPGPSARFADLVEGADLFDRGYALVQVDLRGFGGSSGCLDFMGAGEQGDVAAAIEWSAAQPWSTGDVGMYGKSYDAITGLVGTTLDPEPLKAVVAQEPMWDLQRNIRSNGVPRTTMVDVSRTYGETASMPGMAADDERYRANADYETEHPECLAIDKAGYQTADPDSDYWATRDLAARAEGSDTPLFFTQGFLEWNTEPEGMEEFLANHDGPQRGWLGQWDHVRGNDRVGDQLAMGREGWFAETMAFYDEHLKGVEPAAELPAFAVQDSTGAWRAQDTWPEVDSTATLEVDGGSYLDDGDEGDPEADTGNSFLQLSEPLEQATRVTGTPRISLESADHGTVHVKLHAVAPDGTAVLFDEQVSVLQPGQTDVELKSTEWTLPAGHALAVEIGTVSAGPLSDWIDTPTRERVEVAGAELELDLADPAADVPTEGAPAPYLATYLSLSSQELSLGEPSFAVPAPRG